MSQMAMDLAARDAVLTAHQRKQLVRWLEWECLMACGWLKDGSLSPVSVNTARAILRAWGRDVGDTRFLGGVFPASRWVQAGEIMSDSGRCHGRKIRTFRPRPQAEFVQVKRPDWLVAP
jgi:hypothetical protein